ncbi:MAG: MmgE/PrpD family protein [Rubrivivax sp.]
MQSTEMNIERAIARHIAGCRLDVMPEGALQAARTSIVDTLASAAAGRSANGIAAMVELVRAWGGSPQARVIGSGLRVPAPLAAWCNGAMSRALELDDCIDALPLHPSAAVLPALLAAFDMVGGLSGAKLLRALVIAQDLFIRFGHAVSLNAMQSGRNNLFKVYAATAGVTAALGLDETRVLNALGIASSYAVADGQCALDGSMALRVQYGNVAQGALQAALLAQAGVTGPERFLTGKFGFFAAFEPDHHLDHLSDGLGKEYKGDRISVKPYACCRATHAAVDLARTARTCIQPADPLEAVRHVDVTVSPEVDRLVGSPAESKTRPATGPAAQFSLHWVIACALLGDRVELADTGPQALNDPKRAALAARVRVVARAENRTDNILGRTDVAITLEDGTQWTGSSTQPLGSPSRPVSTDFLRAKLEAGMRHGGFPVNGEEVDVLVARAARVESLQDARLLLDVLA